MPKKINCSVPDAEMAIYLDFEGLKDHPPALAGVLIDDTFKQVVFDDDLEFAAAGKGLRLITLDEFLNELRVECLENGRKLAAFTQHELNKIRKYAPKHTWAKDSYLDTHKLAKRWVNARRYEEWREEVREWSLAHFLLFIDRPFPPHLRVRDHGGNSLNLSTEQREKPID